MNEEHAKRLKDDYRIYADKAKMVEQMWRTIMNENIEEHHIVVFRKIQNYLGEAFKNNYWEKEYLKEKISCATVILRNKYFEKLQMGLPETDEVDA